MPTNAATLALLRDYGPKLGLHVASALTTHPSSLSAVMRLDDLTPAVLGDRFGNVLLRLRRWSTRRFGPEGWRLHARYANGRRVGYELYLFRSSNTKLLRIVVALLLQRAGLDPHLVHVR